MPGQSAEPTESVNRRSAPTPESAAPLSALADAKRIFAGLPDRLPVKIPWWGAILLAVTLTAVGFAYDAGAGNGELGSVFATCYVLGCLLAVVLVQRSGLFTAMIQPPLILFVAVPTSYFLFHSSQIDGLKDILINCGYPLIQRFPLMFFTALVVVALGLVRWYLLRGVEETADDAESPAPAPRRAARRAARAKAAAEQPERPRRPRGEAAEPYERPRRARTGSTSRARHNRPPESDIAASAAAADRRERAAARDRSGRPRRPADQPVDPARRTRRARDPRDPRDLRDQRDPREPRRRSGYDSPYGAPFDADPYERPRRRPRPEGYQPRFEPGYSPDDRYADPYPERPRRPAPDPSHHPVSRVRYRSSDDEARGRARSHRDADPWDDGN